MSDYQAFDDYQEWAKSKAVYNEEYIMYPVLGLVSEAGEVAGKFKKILREPNDHGLTKKDIAKEIGDVLWYVAVLSNDLGYTLGQIVEINKEKLESREKRNTLKGSGDDR